MKAKHKFHYEQVCVRKNKNTAQGYGNMQGKRKVRELYLHTNMSSQIVVKFKTHIKEVYYYICVVCNRFLYKKLEISFKMENCGDVNVVPFSLIYMYGL